MSSPRRLIHEIHRRSLWQVLGIYLAVSWVVFQVVDVIGSNFGLPERVAPAALVLLLLGLPVVIGTAFVQEGVGGSRSSRDAPPSLDTPEDAGEESPTPAEPKRAAPAAVSRIEYDRMPELHGPPVAHELT